MTRVSRLAWTADQIAAIKNNPQMEDEELLTLVNTLGPPRTLPSVSMFRRRKLRILHKRRPTTAPRYRQIALDALERAKAIRDGWPRMTGKPAERERQYLLACYREMQAEQARMAARALAQGEAA